MANLIFLFAHNFFRNYWKVWHKNTNFNISLLVLQSTCWSMREEVILTDIYSVSQNDGHHYINNHWWCTICQKGQFLFWFVNHILVHCNFFQLYLDPVEEFPKKAPKKTKKIEKHFFALLLQFYVRQRKEFLTQEIFG